MSFDLTGPEPTAAFVSSWAVSEWNTTSVLPLSLCPQKCLAVGIDASFRLWVDKAHTAEAITHHQRCLFTAHSTWLHNWKDVVCLDNSSKLGRAPRPSQAHLSLCESISSASGHAGNVHWALPMGGQGILLLSPVLPLWILWLLLHHLHH